MITNEDRLMTVKETATLLGYKTQKSVYQQEERGSFPPVYLPGTSFRKYRKSDVQKFIDGLSNSPVKS
jgi:predicted DNA-binding transcriptional regulator AlpA